MNNKNAKKVSLALALLISFSAIGPNVAKAADASNGESEIVENENNYVSQEKVNEIREKAVTIRSTVVKSSSASSTFLKPIDKIINTLDTIDLTSGAPRVMLASDSLESILIATRDLTNKVERAHRNIGFAVTRAVIVLSDPFASAERIYQESDSLRAVTAAAENAADLTDSDLATVYVKEELDAVIKNAKSVKNKLSDKDLKKQLNDEIAKAAKTRSKLRVTVLEIRTAANELEIFTNNIIANQK